MMYEEKVPPPAQVDIVFYNSSVGHPAVARDSFHEDDTIVGSMLQGQEKVMVYVHQGDAIITYPGNVYFCRPADDVSAFYQPVQSGAPALSSGTVGTIEDELKASK